MLMGLKFSVAELQRELTFCDAIATRYLKRQSRGKFKEAADQLGFIFSNPNQSHPWQIDRDDPLRTEPSWGSCEKEGGGRNLQGQLSFIWELRKYDHRTVELVGKASTAISILEIVDSTVIDNQIFKWHVDVVTDKNAPGPAFHTQVDNPKNLPVPRFPSLLFTPVDCLDFLLGELFQKEWPRHQISHEKIRSFATIQQSRICRLLDDQKTMLEKYIGLRSAWIALKDWKPSDKVILTE